MGLDNRLSFFLSQVGWALPSAIAVIVIAALALLRRDSGLWWKLVVAGAAALLVGQLINIAGTMMIHLLHEYGAHWLVSIPTTILHVVGLALLGAGAITGRRGQAAPR